MTFPRPNLKSTLALMDGPVPSKALMDLLRSPEVVYAFVSAVILEGRLTDKKMTQLGVPKGNFTLDDVNLRSQRMVILSHPATVAAALKVLEAPVLRAQARVEKLATDATNKLAAEEKKADDVAKFRKEALDKLTEDKHQRQIEAANKKKLKFEAIKTKRSAGKDLSKADVTLAVKFICNEKALQGEALADGDSICEKPKCNVRWSIFNDWQTKSTAVFKYYTCDHCPNSGCCFCYSTDKKHEIAHAPKDNTCVFTIKQQIMEKRK